jgi:hypothetical protein
MTRRTGWYWPGPDHELLLRAALQERAEAGEAWRRLRSGLRLDALDRASLQLLPLLGANLRRHGIDDPLAPRLAEIRRASALQNRVLIDGGGPLLRALAGAGLPSLVLKGGALALARYEDIALRPMRDLDVVVPTASAASAVDVLRAAGWVPRAPITPEFIEMQHAADLSGPGLSRCDLHWHVYWECCRPDADEALWASSVALDFEGVPTRMLGPADQLLHVLVHGSRRTRRPVLVWVADAMLVLRAGGIDWSRFVAQAAERRFVLRALTGLQYLREAFAAPVTDDVLVTLRRLRVSAFERFEYAVLNRPQGMLGELPSYWCNYLRIRPRGRMPSPLGFSRYLQQTWRLPSLGAATRGALSRARTRVAAAVLGPPRGPK